MAVHTHDGFIPWSMRRPDTEQLWSKAGWFMDSVPEQVQCIVCFADTEGTEQGLSDWHHCRQCSAMWCDECMEKMYYVARDDVEQDMELRCPQCRKDVAAMQLEARMERIAALGCQDDSQLLLIRYENLFTETAHVCLAHEDGMPFYSLPLVAVARVLSRDELCDVLQAQARADGGRLRRLLRGGDYVDAAHLVLRSYILQLRASVASAATVLMVVAAIAERLRDMSQHAAPPDVEERRARLLAGVQDMLEGERQVQAAPEDTGSLRHASHRRKRRRTDSPSPT